VLYAAREVVAPSRTRLDRRRDAALLSVSLLIVTAALAVLAEHCTVRSTSGHADSVQACLVLRCLPTVYLD
jgi:hypothetical protein